MVSRRFVLRFPRYLIDQPVISRLIRDHDLEVNITKASITPDEEGVMVVEIRGEEENLRRGLEYFRRIGVGVQPLSQDIRRREERCTHCGVCTVICPTGALNLDRRTWLVNFDHEKCIACALCIRACPPRAMEICI